MCVRMRMCSRKVVVVGVVVVGVALLVLIMTADAQNAEKKGQQ